MTFGKFALTWLNRRIRCAARGRPVNSVILVCEALETRLAPAVFLWDPVAPPTPFPARSAPPPNTLWSESQNWLVRDELNNWVRSPGMVPGDSTTRLDDVRFVGELKWQQTGLFSNTNRVISANDPCILDSNRTVRSIKIDDGYTSTITLGHNLTINGGTGAGFMLMNTPATVLGGGVLQITGNSTFTWSAGRLQLDGGHSVPGRGVQIQSPAKMVIVEGGYTGADGPTLKSTTMTVQGSLEWKSGHVVVEGATDPSIIAIAPGGKFNVTAGDRTFGATTGGLPVKPDHLRIENQIDGKFLFHSPSLATFGAHYASTGDTILTSGVMAINGRVEQSHQDSSFQLLNNTTIALVSTSSTLGIRDGKIIGSGTVQGNLEMGNGPGGAATTPIISPGDELSRIGLLSVTLNFKMFSGVQHIEIAGGNNEDGTINDRIAVTQAVTLSGAGPGGQVVGNLLGAHGKIKANTEFTFMTYASRNGDFVSITPPLTFTHGNTETVNPMRYWFKSPGYEIAETKAKVRGKVWNDINGPLRGVREVFEFDVPNVTVRLLDAAGVNEVAATTTDANGNYLFENIAAGIYVAEVVLPATARLTTPNVGPDTTDSDFDPATRRVRIGVYADVANLDAGLVHNDTPIAAADNLRAHKNTLARGNVRLNDTDANGDALTVALATGPLHGAVSLNPDGTFTYTPHTDYTGTDTFTYTLTDGYGGTATGTVNVVVANTTAPTGGSDSYAAAYQHVVDAITGVLANDTNPNGTLTAVLASGPSHGTLELFPDGAFLYIPYDTFTGTDTFTYYPTDADGPGLLTTVTLIVTDTAPTAAADSATTGEDTAVTLAVLGNDSDPDLDTLTVVAASDGLFGTTAVNADGTITYTPFINWNGTDTFAYLIDDGHGRLALATATVTVNPANDAPAIDGPTVVVQKDGFVDIDLRTRVEDVETADADLTFAVSGAVNGTVELLSDGFTARFTPAAGYSGPANFTVAATDTGDGSAAPVTVSGAVGLSVNAPPDVAGGLWAHLAPGQTVSLYLSISDRDGDATTVDGFTQPGQGSVALSGGVFTYTAPAVAFVGTTTFTVTVSDGRGGVTVKTITVELVNQPPVGSDLYLEWTGSGPVTIYPTYYDPDGDPLTITTINQPSVGTVVPHESGSGVVFLPPSGFVGEVTFSYVVDDGHGGTLTVNVTVNVVA